METINITINGMAVEAPKGSTILQAAKGAHSRKRRPQW